MTMMQIWKTTYGVFKFYDSGPLWAEQTGPELMTAYVKNNLNYDEYGGFFSLHSRPVRPEPPRTDRRAVSDIRHSFPEVSSVELQLAARSFREDYRKETNNYSEPWWAKIFK